MRLVYADYLDSINSRPNHISMKEITNNAGIIKSILEGKYPSDGDTPVLMCVVGRSGSGKSRFIQDSVGEAFVHVDAGLIYLEAGGEVVVDFPDPFQDDVNEIGSSVCADAVMNRLDLVLEFSGSDTVQMQVLMRAFEDAGYEVVIKYVSTDLNQATIRNLDEANETVHAQDTDPMHYSWLIGAVNGYSPAPTLEPPAPSTGLTSSLFKRSNEKRKTITSLSEATEILEEFLTFSANDRSSLKDAHTLPHERSKILDAIRFLESNDSEVEGQVSVDRSAVLKYHIIDAHDRDLLNELNASPSERDITIRMADESVSASELEDLELIRAHRERLRAKYDARYALESSETA